MRRVVPRILSTPRSSVRMVSLGAAVSPKEIAAAAHVPLSVVGEILNPAETSWTIIDRVYRAKAAAFKDVNDVKQDFSAIQRTVKKGDVALLQGKATFTAANFTSAQEMLKAYHLVMQPLRAYWAQAEHIQGHIFELSDHLKLGLTVFKQADLDEKTKKYKAYKESLATLKATTAKYVADHFDTAIYNDIVALLRLVKNETARVVALNILDDMSVAGVPFDATTQLLLKNLAFGDGPYDDSNLLFTLVEYPERGEISISKQPLEAISNDALKTISERHQTPLTEDLALLRLADTHPNLQRSPE